MGRRGGVAGRARDHGPPAGLHGREEKAVLCPPTVIGSAGMATEQEAGDPATTAASREDRILWSRGSAFAATKPLT